MGNYHLYFASCVRNGGIYHYTLQGGTLCSKSRTVCDRPMYIYAEKGGLLALLRQPFTDSQNSGLISFTLDEEGNPIPAGEGEEGDSGEGGSEDEKEGEEEEPEPNEAWKDFPVDPATGYLVDPTTGDYLDPQLGTVVSGGSLLENPPETEPGEETEGEGESEPTE